MAQAAGAAAPAPASIPAAMDEAVSKQAEMEQDFAKKLESTQTGVLPVAFYIPARGQIVRFGKLLVVGENPGIRMVYVHFRVLEIFLVLLLAVIARRLYRRREIILENLMALRIRIQSAAKTLKALTQPKAETL